ncbi:glycogen synthase GlgA [Enterovirga aerilata]|uniref:Glycogen synthase n=1 Tax=Enterovirga aerilata TaxID=2730920 RepID=A0A849I880_9HYPH|nr:glycogen synthase GlgA [Enterovirga sp. DB1703]NNM73598.1 glycogen synthase GlgA [Enterovirga sp. DB1703]
MDARVIADEDRVPEFVAALGRGGAPSEGRAVQRILYVTSEMADYVKAGGLGDVSAALPRSLGQRYDVRVLIPGYRQVTSREEDIPVVARLPAAHGLPACELGRIDCPDGLTVYVILCPDLYDREGSPYGDESGADWADNDIRFGRLGLAAAQIAAGVPDLGWTPSLLHLNDWPSALGSAYVAWAGLQTPSVLTIHNLAYQGLFDPSRLPGLGVPDSAFGVEGVEFYGKLSFLKAGIVYASHVTTVSQTYAREITTPEFGCGLDGLLRKLDGEGRLTGILNGIDESWDPRTDRHLESPFDPNDLKGKKANADEVRREFGLAVSRGPLFAVVSRLVHQKGVDLTIESTESIVRQGGQVVVTGRGEERFERAMQKLAERYPAQVGVRIGFEEQRARRMFAGSDFLLMPSRFEPCGLSQMYAQRMGSLPIARQTGGLADTIKDGVTGFLFRDPSLGAMLSAIYRAVDAFGSRRKLNAMRRAAMSETYGWTRSAAGYCGVYDRALAGPSQ